MRYNYRMRKNRLIPFRYLPASWGLSGKSYEEAEARYLYDGFELDERLAEINTPEEELAEKLVELKYEHGLYTEYEYELERAKLIEDEVEREVAIVEAKIRADMIDPFEGEKTIATLRQEPWIRVVDDGINHEDGIDGYYFEFDWNEYWVDALRAAGYMGKTEDAIVQCWFQDVCRQEASASMGAPPINGGIVVG